MNYNLLSHKQHQPTITSSENMQLYSILKIQHHPSITKVDATQQSSTFNTLVMVNSTSLKDLTDDQLIKYDPYFLNKIPNKVIVSSKQNSKTGRAAHVA